MKEQAKMTFSPSKRPIFLSVCLSIFSHILLLILFINQSQVLQKKELLQRDRKDKIWLSSMTTKKKGDLLKTIFQEIKASPQMISEPTPLIEPSLHFSYKPLKKKESPPSFHGESSLAEHLIEPKRPLFLKLPENEPLKLFSPALELENFPIAQKWEPPFPSPTPIKTPSLLSFEISPPSSSKEPSSREPLFKGQKSVEIFQEEPVAFTSSLSSSHFENLEVPSLKELSTCSYSDFFETELSFFKREEGDYIFALTLIPRETLSLEKIKQNYIFLIDRSNSVLKERLHAAKSAVLRALSELGKDDTFNIIAFDSKMEKFSPHPLKVTSKTKNQAKQFLDKIQLGSFFTSGDLFQPLFLTIPVKEQDDEIYTAVLITDGEHLSKKHSQHALVRDWTLYNQGKVSLFGIGLGNDVHLRNLEAATVFNRGRFMHSSTKRGIKRKLLKLMKMIQTPVAKKISCEAISLSKKNRIEIFSKTSQSSNLFLNEPYTLLGVTDSLEDFILFVQGKSKSNWLNIKKKISFQNAKQGNASLLEEWTLLLAFRYYERSISEENPDLLVKANELLKSFNLDADFK